VIKINFLFITDTHIPSKVIPGRLDDYAESIVNKFEELKDVIVERNIDYIIHGGDLFDKPKVPLDLAGRIAKIINSYNIPFLVVPGNHDLYAYNIDTIKDTMLGMYASTGTIEILDRAGRNIKIGKHRLRIEGQPYYKDIDKGNPDDNMMRESGSLNILVSHSMLIDKGFEDMEGVNKTYISDIETNADLILVGHYHPGINGVKTVKNPLGTLVVNPGSMGRKEVCTRQPQYCIISVEEINGSLHLNHPTMYEFECAKSYKDVFDFTKKQEVKDSDKTLDNFKEYLNNSVFLSSENTIEGLLKEVCKEMPKEVKEKADNIFESAKANKDELFPAIKGYKQLEDDIYIKSIELTNFQSHINTTIEFVKGMNIICGESGEGKTSILRALQWCLYDSIKGNEFITTGQTECKVKVVFSNDTYIERGRSLKKTGYYKILDINGKEHEYEGFGHNIPIDIANIHQMPIINLTKDISTILNYSEQLDGMFLVKESAQAKAQIIGRIIGTENIDISIKEMNKELLATSKECKIREADLEGLTLKLEPYKDLHLEKQRLDNIKIEVVKYNLLKEEIIKLKRINEKYNKIKDNKLNIPTIDEERILDIKINYENIKTKIIEYDKLNIISNKLTSINEKDIEISRQKNIHKKNLSNNKALKIEEVLNKTTLLYSSYERLFNIYSNTGTFQNDIHLCKHKIGQLEYRKDYIKNKIELLNNKVNEYKDLKELSIQVSMKHYTLKGTIEEIEAKKEKIKLFNDYLILNEKEQDDIVKEISQNVKEMNICEHCGHKLTKKNFDYIIERGIN
jgi:DNA repair protein SbcC/Rad50